MPVALTLLVSLPSWSADFDANYDANYDKGMAAYERGDYVAALREWTPLAEQGDAIAQFSLGVMYERGEGAQQDYGQAVEWYRRAAEQGDAITQFNLGVMYEKGQGIGQDFGQAVK